MLVEGTSYLLFSALHYPLYVAVVLQRFIFPLKFALENGNDYSQFQRIFFPPLHKS